MAIENESDGHKSMFWGLNGTIKSDTQNEKLPYACVSDHKKFLKFFLIMILLSLHLQDHNKHVTYPQYGVVMPRKLSKDVWSSDCKSHISFFWGPDAYVDPRVWPQKKKDMWI